MTSVFRIDAALQTYQWGMADTIPTMLGLPPREGPVAEAWWGAHPSAPSPLADGTGTLADAIAADPAGMLGEGRANLPYLVKVLAIAKPLSIQVHPTVAQAEQGYADEDAAGVPVDAPSRTFKDRGHKPEMIIAITPLRLLVGFRPVDELVADLRALGPLAEPLVAAALRGPDLHPYVALALEGDVPASVLESLAASAESDTALGFAGRAARVFPGDPGALVALAMNPVVLAPGEACYVPVQQVHSYQSGIGVEIMSNSDNVVRGGLTPKAIDVRRLEHIVDGVPAVPVRPEVTTVGRSTTFRPPIDEFALSVVEGGSAPVARGPRVVIALRGDVTVHSAFHALHLAQGQAAFVPFADGPVTVDAPGTAYVAQVGRHEP